jgi:phosphoglycolate phosphatase-like HAD superfamily hydrolase
MRTMLADHGIEATPAEMAKIPEVLESAMSANATRLRERGYALPGARTILQALRDTPGIIQAPLTGNIRPNAFTKLSVFGLHEYLDFDVGAYGSDDHTRASLVGIAHRRATAKYNTPFDPSNTVLLGDTWRDVRAGRDGGAFVVAIASGEDSIDRLTAAGADIVLPDICDTHAVVAAITSVRHRPERDVPSS